MCVKYVVIVLCSVLIASGPSLIFINTRICIGTNVEPLIVRESWERSYEYVRLVSADANWRCHNTIKKKLKVKWLG